MQIDYFNKFQINKIKKEFGLKNQNEVIKILLDAFKENKELKDRLNKEDPNDDTFRCSNCKTILKNDGSEIYCPNKECNKGIDVLFIDFIDWKEFEEKYEDQIEKYQNKF